MPCLVNASLHSLHLLTECIDDSTLLAVEHEP